MATTNNRSNSTTAIIALGAAAAAATAGAALLFLRRNESPERNDDDDGEDEQHHRATPTTMPIQESVSIQLTDEDSLFYKFDVAPITTLTWFDGNYEEQALVVSLEARMRLVIRKNPWLQGRISYTRQSWLKGTYQLTYHEHDDDDNDHNDIINLDENLTVVDSNDSPLTRTMPIEEQNRVLLRSDVYLKDVFLRASPTQPLFRVTLIPCNKNPSKAFALVFQMSHSVGDGATYYKLMEMICGGGGGGSDEDHNVEKLIPERIRDSKQQQIDAMGGLQEQSYLTSFGFMFQTLKGMVLNSWKGPLPYKYKIYDLDDRDLIKIDEIKKSYGTGKDDLDGAVPSFVSTNDILTSWLMNNTKVDYGLMAINWRNRLKGHTDLHVGNYENIILYTPQDFMSPQLIRQSIQGAKQRYRRSVTNDRPFPSNWTMMNSKVCIVTNWSTFAKPNVLKGCVEVHHFPLILPEMVPTHTIRMLILFRAASGGGPGGKKIGLCYPPGAMSCHNEDDPLRGLSSC